MFLEKNKIGHFLSVFILFFVTALPAYASDILISPRTHSVSMGQTFTKDIYISSSDHSINAVTAKINYPPDKIVIKSISDSVSIVDFWVHEPSFSNVSGTATLEGVLITPGFQGSVGNLATVTFQAVGQGIANISVTEGSILANDGLATNVTDTLGSSAVTINTVLLEDPEPETPVTPIFEEDLELIPLDEIISETEVIYRSPVVIEEGIGKPVLECHDFICWNRLLEKYPNLFRLAQGIQDIVIILTPVFGLLFILAIITYWLIQRFTLFRVSLDKEFGSTNRKIHSTLRDLEGDVDEYIKFLEKNEIEDEVIEKEKKVLLEKLHKRLGDIKTCTTLSAKQMEKLLLQKLDEKLDEIEEGSKKKTKKKKK